MVAPRSSTARTRSPGSRTSSGAASAPMRSSASRSVGAVAGSGSVFRVTHYPVASFTIRVQAENRPVTDRVDPRTMKRALLVCLLALVAAAPASAAQRGLITDRGIVQSISPLQLVLRSLDGSTLVFQIRPKTVILVNGQPATV